MQTFFRRGTASVSAAACAMLLTPVVMVSFAGVAHAQDVTAVPNPVVTLDIQDAKLEQAISALKVRTGITDIVIQNPNGKRFAPVTVTLKDKSLDYVLRTVARSAGAVLTIEEGVYYIRPVDDAAPAPTPTPQPVAPVMPEAAPVRKNLITAKISLMYILPSTAKRLIEEPTASSLVGVEYELKNRNVGPTFQDVGAKQPVNTAIPDRPLSNGGGVSAGQTSDGVSAQQAPGFGGFQGGGNNRGGGNNGGGNGPQNGNNAQGTLKPVEIDAIISYDADNSLIVKSQTPEAIEELRQIIRFLDVKPRQVTVKAEFVNVSINDADSFGISWGITPLGNLDVSTSALGSASSITLAYASGNAVANLRASLLRQTTNLIQSPIISTLNNVTASINISDSQPIFVSTVVVNNNQAITSNQVINSLATNTLQVTPHINGDGTITLGVFPQLQSQQVVSGPNGQQATRTATTNLSTTRIIRSGETMVVGGFITKQDVRSTNDVPFLSKLPIIGSLFKSRERTVTGSEVLIFLTPTIIDDVPQGVTGTGGAAPATTP